ncbi:M23 family metallopeptidase [Natronorubrum halophilum]|uniref:M23 family metallopeptidase n=1 Tax=Natronorubrum halophilum TaxID=1702106 RepID=UPI000EF6B19C|nr:M23 family metallopeptidase [Natronorubrum halophilum]
MTDGDTDAGEKRQPKSRAGRLRRRLHELDPARFGVLGVLSLPGYLVESLAFMRMFTLFFLLFFWVLLEPLVDLALKRSADSDTEPTDWIRMGDWRELVVAYFMIPVTFLNPLALVQDLLQMLGSGVAYVRHRGSVPVAGDDQQASYRLPVEGTWTVVNGSLEREYSHSWLPMNQRYAYDFVVTDEDGRSLPEGTGPAVGAYHCYDEPVLAPADGVVVDVLDTEFEPSCGGGFSHPLKRDIRGNYVTIQHAPDEYSCLAHLVPSSVAVEPGERVERGQSIGRCGHSGNSSEPHLHFQVQDHPTFEMAAGVPVRFENATVESPWLEDDDPRPAVTEDEAESTAITAGQRVTAVGSADRKRDSDDQPLSIPGRKTVATLERLAFGGIVGGLLMFVAGIVVGPGETALVLAAAALVGVGFWLVAGRWNRARRPGGVGTSLGIALVAALWAGFPAVRSSTPFVLVGVALYVLVAEYDRVRLRRAYGSRKRPQSESEGERRAGT